MKYKIVKLFALTWFCVGLTGLHAQSMKDIDGNLYKTVTIGTQIWMAENLKTTKYNDGIAIPLVTDDKEWGELTTPAYCWYKNDSKSKNTFGALYNWFTVNTNKLCPKNWHVPTDAEWTTLTTYLGGENAAGGKLKEKGIVHWESPNVDATNESGFTAISSGDRKYDGTFDLSSSNIIYFRSNGYWWSSTEVYAANAYYRRLYNTFGDVYRSPSTKQYGYSVRCLHN